MSLSRVGDAHVPVLESEPDAGAGAQHHEADDLVLGEAVDGRQEAERALAALVRLGPRLERVRVQLQTLVPVRREAVPAINGGGRRLEVVPVCCGDNQTEMEAACCLT